MNAPTRTQDDGAPSSMPPILLRPAFLAAAALPRAEQEQFLQEACAGDPAMRAELEALLRFDASGAPVPVLDQPGGDPSPSLAVQPTSAGGRRSADAGSARGAFPRSFGDYTLIGVLGEGSYGRVYRARQSRPSREVAIKLLHLEVTSRETLRRFANEAEALGRLRHPGIAQVYEAGCLDGRPYIAMECVEGEPLSSICSGSGPSLDDRGRVALIAAIADAIDHAHLQGVIHRDLKPANVVVDRDGRPHVLDFGIAKIVDATGRHGDAATSVVLGTLRYLSPEQTAGASGDTRSDVYALGVMLYELISRRPLFGGEASGETVLSRIRDRSPAPLRAAAPWCSRDLSSVVAKAMARDPSLRYRAAGDFADDLRRVLRSQPVLARPRSLGGLVWRAAMRRKLTTAAALVVVVTATAAASSWIDAQRRAATAERESHATASELLKAVVGPLATFVGTNTSRLALLRQAGPAIERFAAANRDDEGVQSDYARYLELLADANLESGPAAPLRSVREAVVRIRSELAASRPDDAERQASHAIALVKLGDVLKVTQGPRAALDLYETALRMQDELLEGAPSHASRLSDVCWSLQRVGEWRRRTGGEESGLAAQRRHTALSRVYAAAAPTSGDARRSLAAALVVQSHESFARHEFLVAAEGFAEALRAIDEAIRLEPGAVADELQRLSVLQSLAATERRSQGDPTGLQRLDEAAAAARSLLSRNGGDSTTPMILASILSARGELLAGLGRHADAVESLSEAVRASRGLLVARPNDPELRLQLACALFTLSHAESSVGHEPGALAAESIQLIEGLRQQVPDDPKVLTHLAVCLATSPTSAQRDGRRAAQLARRACELTSWRSFDAILAYVRACGAPDAHQDPSDVLDLAIAAEVAEIDRSGGNSPSPRLVELRALLGRDGYRPSPPTSPAPPASPPAE